MTPWQTLAATATLLAASNLFMTFAWYGHLKHLQASPWYVAALVSWGFKLNYLWAALCLMAAVYSIFA